MEYNKDRITNYLSYFNLNPGYNTKIKQIYDYLMDRNSDFHKKCLPLYYSLFLKTTQVLT